MRRDEPGFNPSAPRRVSAGDCTVPIERELPSSAWCDALADALAEVADVANTGWVLDVPQPTEPAQFRVTLDIADGRWHRLHVRPRPAHERVQPVPSPGRTRSEQATADLVSMASARRNYVFGVVRFAHDPRDRTIFVQRV